MDLVLLDEHLSSAGEPGFRARQIWEWAARGGSSYDEMTNLPRELRGRLADEVPFSSLRTVHESLAWSCWALCSHVSRDAVCPG